jgi:hypothetical protein
MSTKSVPVSTFSLPLQLREIRPTYKQIPVPGGPSTETEARNGNSRKESRSKKREEKRTKKHFRFLVLFI